MSWFSKLKNAIAKILMIIAIIILIIVLIYTGLGAAIPGWLTALGGAIGLPVGFGWATVAAIGLAFGVVAFMVDPDAAADVLSRAGKGLSTIVSTVADGIIRTGTGIIGGIVSAIPLPLWLLAGYMFVKSREKNGVADEGSSENESSLDESLSTSSRGLSVPAPSVNAGTSRGDLIRAKLAEKKLLKSQVSSVASVEDPESFEPWTSRSHMSHPKYRR